MSDKTVLILGGHWPVRQMFLHRNYTVLADVSQNKNLRPDIVCFTGGSDITPAMYGQQKLSCTKGIDRDRDFREKDAFLRFEKTLKVGICRGGQLLNILSGGNMYQHVDNHGSGTHECIDLLTNKKIMLNTHHHQMMIPHKSADVLCITDKSTVKISKPVQRELPYDPEVIWYESTKSLCFQAHPEYMVQGASVSTTTEYFFELLSRFSMEMEDTKNARKVG